ncbi:MAG: PKD domain-containing protein [Flavobacteriales bacterium]|nr:PKD domain-containing protein [Flavobacteriales bacterium]MCB9447523.1 PKD domain-containing protein [Flavobacteriales bacterium]
MFSPGLHAATRTSVSTGNWGTNSTWDCNCTPATTDDVVISNNTTVTLNANTTIRNVTINSGSTLNNANRRISITGTYTNNGDHAGSGNINLDATTGGSISGTGTFSHTGILNINNGNFNILAGTNLTKTTGRLTIANGLTVHNYGTIIYGDIIRGGNSASTWINETNSTLKAGSTLLATGTLIANASGNTVSYYAAGNQTLKAPQNNEYFNLTLEGTGTKSLSAATYLYGDLNILSTLDVTTSNYAITIEGNWDNEGTFTYRSGTITFTGNNDQIITGALDLTFYRITINKAAGNITQDKNITVNNRITMTAGTITTGTNTLTLGISAASPGTLTYSTGSVIGTFERWVASTGVTYTFPMASANYFVPAYLTFTNLTPGTLIISFSESYGGTLGLPLGESGDSIRNVYSEGYWNLTAANSLASTNYGIDLNASALASFTVDNSTRILKRTNEYSAWTLNGNHALPTGSTVKRTNLSGFSQFGLGDTTNCDPPATSAISGNDSVCINTTGSAYSVTNTPGSTYAWSATGGTIASGQGTNSVTVNWGATGMQGQVAVIETNSCSAGEQVAFDVNIHSISPASISGNTSVPENATGEVYSVTAEPGYTYSWVVTGGSITAGQNTNSITVTWGAATTGNVEVTATSACGSATPLDEDINVYVVITSKGTGQWNNTNTWDCGCTPTSTSNVVIKATHTVTLAANTTVANLVIEPTGTLFDNNRRMTVTGDLTVNGTYTGTNRLDMNGTNKTINGTGTISTSGEFRLSGGNKVIHSGANINRSPGIMSVNGGITVQNHGIMLLGSDLTANNASSTWINDESASLTIGGALLSTGILEASASNNTVEYNGASGQTIKATDYFNLQSTGLSTLNLAADMIAYGDVYIGTGNTLNSNNHNLQVKGNWTNEGGTFNETTGTVTFNGIGTQMITNTAGEAFNSMTIAAGSSVQVANGTSMSINGTLTNTGGIVNNGTLTLTGGYSGQTGNLSGNGNTILTGGNWAPAAGKFQSGQGTITFQGTSAQTITSNNSFYNLTVNNSNGVAVGSGNQSLQNILVLQNGNFNTNNNFTLLSTATRTGRIDSVRSGASITGKITIQRYISGDAGFRNVSFPITDATFLELNDDITLTGMTGTGNGYSNYWASVYYYDEDYAGGSSIDSGWVAVKNVNDAIDPTKGYDIWMYNVDLPATLSVTGTPYVGDNTFTLTYDNTGSPTDDGWNLVNNPYPAPIDWDHSSVVRNGSVSGAIYIFRDDIQQYASYVSGLGTNNGSNVIPSSQAFWVQTVGATPSLTMKERSKSAIDTAFMAMAVQQLITRVKLTNSKNESDECVIQVQDGSSLGFDPALDARKLWSIGTGKPNIAMVMNNDILSINRLPFDGEAVTVPLTVRIEKAGTHTIQVDLSTMETSSCIMLEDRVTHSWQDMRTDGTYTCTIDSGETNGRFYLYLGRPMTVETAAPSCTGKADGSIIVDPGQSGAYNLELMNNNSTVIRKDSIRGMDTLTGIPAGSYTLTLTGIGLCGNMTQDVTLTAPASVQVSGTVTNQVSCTNKADGAVMASASGGTPPYTFIWNNGDQGQTINSLVPGDYTVTISDQLGCPATNMVTLENPEPVVSGFILNEDTLKLPDNAEAACFNMTSGAQSYVWDFGDGSPLSYTKSPTHTYSQEGTYVIRLVAGMDDCTDTTTHTVVILPPDVVTGTGDTPGNSTTFYATKCGDQLCIISNIKTHDPVTITLYDIAGRRMYTKDFQQGMENNLYFNPGKTNGILLVQIKTRTGVFNQKLMTE